MKQLLFWIFTTIFTFVINLIFNNYDKYKKNEKKESKHLKSGVLSLLKSEIVKTYEKCIGKGFCTIYEIELINEIYQNYSQLGGNGCCSKIIDDLKKLPIK